MKNRGLVLCITFILTALSIYYLSFTWKSAIIQNQANKYAKDANNNIDFSKKQKYLDSLWKKPVYKLLWANFTYEEVKEKELTQGLDLQGGMNVTLEISPVELIKNLASNTSDPEFVEAIEVAKKRHFKEFNESFVDLFYHEYRKLNKTKKLNVFFASASSRSKINFNSTDQQVLDFLKNELNNAIDRSLQILRTRIDRFGTANAIIQKIQSSGRIQIELPGVNNPSRVRKLLKDVAKLYFYQVYDTKDLEEPFKRLDYLFIKEQKQKAIPGIRKIYKSPFSSRYGRYIYPISEVDEVKDALKREDVKKILPKDVKFLWAVKSKKIDDQETLTLYPLKTKRGKPLLEGDVIINAEVNYTSPTNPSVSMQMNAKGSKNWKKITRQNIGKPIAIVLDDHVYSSPLVQSEIPNGSSQISGNFTIEEAQDLTNILKAGSLPAPVKIVEEATVGPTLGKRAQIQGIMSMIIGLGLVIIFMIFYYAKGGLVANFALLINMLFILGTLAQFNASLTLPGIAGIVLTIGMSIDANVLIFERIREEIALGSFIKNAITTGYEKAYSSIIDSNLTTFLTGVILYMFGQGPVKGFATTMMIGIVSSFFSSVFITRLILVFMTKDDKKNVSFYFNFTKNIFKNLNFNFFKLRKISYATSLLIILIGLFLIWYQNGLNLGVDFRGGRSYIVNFSKVVEPSALKSFLSANNFENQGTEVKTFGFSNTLKIITSYLMDKDIPNIDEVVKKALIDGISKFTNLTYSDSDNNPGLNEFTISGFAKVGATVASDIQSSSQKAILLSLIMIFLYILVRFRKWQFGIASVIALLHDSLIVFSAFAIARAFGFAFEIDQVFIAAILTVIGYSINDTVVVFDRIRENMKLKNTKDFFEVANKSINETMSRTLITSFTTFIAVFILFVFGGEVLRGFSFAMLVGIIFGTYSSIFIATPVALDLSISRNKNK